MLLRFLFSLSCLTAVAPAVLARGDSAAQSPAERAAAKAPSAGLAAQIDGLLDARFAALEATAPLPDPASTDTAAIARRLGALRELDSFIRGTVEGLVNAAAGPEMRTYLDDSLAPVMARHRRAMAVALAALLDHPLVRTQGWFVISRFGAQADRNAALLVSGASDWSMKHRIFARLKELERAGETGGETVRLVARSISAADSVRK